MTKWTDFFRVERAVPDEFRWDEEQYVIMDVNTNTVVGKYKDYLYAKKQAKHKFKKMQAKIEKLLLK